jgi:phosphate transport system substrate-binding protein
MQFDRFSDVWLGKGRLLKNRSRISAASKARVTAALETARSGAAFKTSRVRTLIALTTCLSVMALPSAAGALTLTGSGSSAAQPYLLELFRAYSRLHKRIQFRYIPDGGNAGVKDVQAGRVEFAVNTRPPLPSDSGTTYGKLFLDGLCIAVNKANGLRNVSLTTLKNMFTGIDTNWSQVQGSNLRATIDPIGRNAAAGTYTFFSQAALGNQTQSSNVLQATSDGLVQVGIEHDPNSIGYVGLAHSQTGVRKLTIGGVPCDDAHIKNGTYPLLRYVWSVLPTANPNLQVEQFFNWVRTSAAAGLIIHRAGAVPAFNR